MKHRIFRNPSAAIVAAFIVIIIASCTSKSSSENREAYLIPKPVSMTKSGGTFTLNEKTLISFSAGLPEVEKLAGYLQSRLKPATGFNLSIKQVEAVPKSGIYIGLAGEAREGDEGYELSVTKKLVQITATTPAGLFHGIQTLRQLFPPEIELSTTQNQKWEISACSISDHPLYSYRGMMLDVSRHFFKVEDVKKLIDQISYYKLNALHLHLSDDQGWRIEIKSWPKLTEIGGSTQVGGEKGGYYTQDEYANLVKYAAERFITIIPEIDMPGHTNAALASYPELNCSGKATELYTGTEVGFSTLCTNKEITYKFIDDVVGEIAALTPGPWFHMGGDESHSTKREDYIPFVNKVQEIVVKHGKKVIGWDDISIGTLQPNTFAQYWANAENAKNAVAQGAKLIMSPAKKHISTCSMIKIQSLAFTGPHI